MYKTYNMEEQHIMKALYKENKFIKDLLSQSLYRKYLYRDDLTNDEITLFETIMELQRVHKSNKVTYTQEILSKYTRLTRRKFDSTRKKLEERKLLITERAGFKAPLTYSINIKYIQQNPTAVYDITKLPKNTVISTTNDITHWFST